MPSLAVGIGRCLRLRCVLRAMETEFGVENGDWGKMSVGCWRCNWFRVCSASNGGTEDVIAVAIAMVIKKFKQLL